MAMDGRHYVNVKKLTKKMHTAQNGKCGYCSTDMYLRSEVSRKYRLSHKLTMATFDHIVPVSAGGTWILDNAVAACHKCNGLKGSLPVAEFLERYDELLQYLNEKPIRDEAKRIVKKRKQIYIIARFALRLGKTVDDLFLEYLYNSTYEMVRDL